MKYLKKRNQKGFTLVELLVTMVVLGIITAMAVPLVRKLRLDQEDQKYKTYMQSMEYSAKLYVDSYGEDSFAKRETGCVKVSYSELVGKKLLKDISVEDITCNDKETSFTDKNGKKHTSTVYIRKNGNTYEYFIEAICDGKRYTKGEDDLSKDNECEIASSEFGYLITPLSDTSKTKKQAKIDVEISNARGINPYVDIDYWFEDKNGNKTEVKKLPLKVPSEEEQKKTINDKEAVTAKATVVTPEGLNGEYKLVISDNRLLTLEGESEKEENKIQKSGKFILDNEAPSISGKLETSEKDPIYNVTNPLFTLDASDSVTAKKDLKICVSIDTDNCSKDVSSIKNGNQYQSINDYFGTATSKKVTMNNSYNSSSHNLYITVSDLAGNYTTQVLPYRVAQQYTITYNINTPREPQGTLSRTTDYVIYNDWDEPNRTWGVLTSRKKQTLLTPTRPYYDFKGWNTKANGTGTTVTNDTKVGDTKNVTVYAQWAPINYSLNYNLAGGTVNGTNPTSFNYESQTFTLINPTKKGYNFTGWTGTGLSGKTSTVTISAGSHDNRNYTATYDPINYTISYNLNGGTVSGNPTSYNCETETITLKNPTKKGYTFTGWTGTGLSGKTMTVTIPKGSYENRSYTANYELANYTITYNLGGGTISGTNPATYTIETANFTLKNPTKTGYKFTGWTGTGLSGKTMTVTVNKGSYENRTYTANYDPISYTVEYYNGKTKIGSTTHKYDTAKALTKMATLGGTQSGYTFYGWTANNDTTSVTRKYSDGESIKNLTSTDKAVFKIYAIWKRDITFYSGIKNATTTTVSEFLNPYTPTYSLKLPTPAAISNWTTLGWRDDTSTGAKEYDSGQSLTSKASATKFYGAYSRTVTLSYDGNGSTSGSVAAHTSTQYYNSNGNITSIGAVTLKNNGFTKTGYLFQKWADGSTSGTQYAQGASFTFNPGVSTAPTKKMYAIWDIKKYSLSFNGNGSTGGSTAALTCSYNQNCTLTANGFTKTGHTFTGWATSTSGSKVYNDKQTIKLTQDSQTLNLYAVWSKNSYTVTYDYKTNGGTSATKTSASVAYDAAVDLSATATKSGWTFVGWNTDKNAKTALSSYKMPAGAKTLYAIFKKPAVTYSAKWNANGATLSSTSELKCTIAEVYNTATQATSCTVKAPTITRSGWTIVGFGTSASATSSSFASAATLTLNSSNTGKTWYAVTSKKVTTTFDANGGGSVTSPTCTMYNAQTSCTVKTPSTSRSGYTFFAWATSKTATSGGSAANTNISLSGNATYYAIWYTSKRFSAEGSKNYTISGVRAIKSITETEGTASNKSLSGTTYSFKANGEAYTYSYSDTCATSATSKAATPITTENCTCPSGYTKSGKTCNYSKKFSNGWAYYTYACWCSGTNCSPSWTFNSHTESNNTCSIGSTSSWSCPSIPNNAGSCTKAEMNAYKKKDSSKVTCTYYCEDTKSASCTTTTTGYKCSSGTLVGSTCKSCSQGSYNSSSGNCQYSCTKSATGYSHDITVYYFV